MFDWKAPAFDWRHFQPAGGSLLEGAYALDRPLGETQLSQPSLWVENEPPLDLLGAPVFDWRVPVFDLKVPGVDGEVPVFDREVPSHSEERPVVERSIEPPC